jgi:hypothetical protein
MKIKSFSEFINESINEKIMDTKYWLTYNQDTSGGQVPKEHMIMSKDFDDTFSLAVSDWNEEADGVENRIKGNQVKKIEKMAMEFFKKEKQISVAIIHAMISQES